MDNKQNQDDVVLPKRKPGRPKGETARTGSQRAKDSDAALIEGGGKIIRTLRLSPEAGKAFDLLRPSFNTDREVFEFSLLYFRKSKEKQE